MAFRIVSNLDGTQEIQDSLGNTLVHFDSDGNANFTGEVWDFEGKLESGSGGGGSGLGDGQTWVDVGTQRDAGITYTNDTGRAIAVSVDAGPDYHQAIRFNVDGLPMGAWSSYHPTTKIYCGAFTIVPAGSTYVLVTEKGYGESKRWKELR